MARPRVIDLGDSGKPPGGQPLPGTTNLGDVEWMLTRLRRWVFAGGDPSDPRYQAQLDLWLDYRSQLRGSRLEHVGTTRELTPGPGSEGE